MTAQRFWKLVDWDWNISQSRQRTIDILRLISESELPSNQQKLSFWSFSDSTSRIWDMEPKPDRFCLCLWASSNRSPDAPVFATWAVQLGQQWQCVNSIDLGEDQTGFPMTSTSVNNEKTFSKTRLLAARKIHQVQFPHLDCRSGIAQAAKHLWREMAQLALRERSCRFFCSIVIMKIKCDLPTNSPWEIFYVYVCFQKMCQQVASMNARSNWSRPRSDCICLLSLVHSRLEEGEANWIS